MARDHGPTGPPKTMKTQCETLGWQAKAPAPRQLAVGQALSPANRSVTKLVQHYIIGSASWRSRLGMIVAAALVCCTLHAADWGKRASDVTIVRDDWGIAHVYGKTDADAVFGMVYAQAEDDFNRVETNYINSMGRLAEAEGESKIYQDLRMKLFIDPEELKKQYAASPAWLKALMNALADGLNFYLSKHPEREAARHSRDSSRGWR